jgi:hypothetical protein
VTYGLPTRVLRGRARAAAGHPRAAGGDGRAGWARVSVRSGGPCARRG